MGSKWVWFLSIFEKKLNIRRNYRQFFSWMYSVCYLYKYHHTGSILLHRLNSFSCNYLCRPHCTYRITNTHKKSIINITLQYILTLGQYHLINHHIHIQILDSFLSVIKISYESNMHPLYLMAPIKILEIL